MTAVSTTVTDSNNMIYDEIIISSGTFKEFGSAPAVLGSSIGIVAFDNDTGLCRVMASGDIGDLVSDHRPVYARFRIDMGDDDGPGSSVENEPVQNNIRAANYPNPFNPSTIISFYTPETANVNLTVYNVTGQKVAAIIDKTMNAGNYSVVWDAKGMSSGIYFYTVESMGKKVCGKMLLMK